MGKYSKDQLEQMAAGVFKTSSEPVFYANSAGTFYNGRQYKSLSDAEKKDCIAFENPKYIKPKAEGKKAEAKKEEKKAEGGEPEGGEGGEAGAGEGGEPEAKKGKKK